MPCLPGICKANPFVPSLYIGIILKEYTSSGKKVGWVAYLLLISRVGTIFKVRRFAYFCKSSCFGISTFPTSIWLAVFVIVFIFVKRSGVITISSGVIAVNASSDDKIYSILLSIIDKIGVVYANVPASFFTINASFIFLNLEDKLLKLNLIFLLVHNLKSIYKYMFCYRLILGLSWLVLWLFDKFLHNVF